MFLLAFFLLTPVLLAAPSVLAQAPEAQLPPPPPIRDPRFGAVESYVAPDVADAAGVAWTRVFLRWPQLQLSGIHDWNPHYFPDEVMERELASGRQLVGLLIGTPPWAGETGSVREPPKGLSLPYDHPDNLWGQFVYRVVSRYKGKIDHWIIWNEPDIWDENHPGMTWSGSVEEFVQLLKVAYQAAKAANPNAVIHLPATTYWWDHEYGRPQYFERLLDAILAHPEAPEWNSFFDVASAHIYFNRRDVWRLTRYFRAELDERGLEEKPLWINETNAPPSNDPLHPAPTLRFQVTLDQQCDFVVQAWAMGLAAGAERIALYKTADEPWLPKGVEPYGMVRKDGSLRPVFWTYRVVVTYLGGFTDAQLAEDGAITRVVISRGELGTTQVVWNNTGQERRVTVPALGSQALLVDPLGPVDVLQPQGGRYTLTLAPARFPTGGRPLLVVEGPGAELRIPRPALEGESLPTTPESPPQSGGQPSPVPTSPTAPATATVEPTQTPRTTPTFTLTPSSTATHTPTPTPSSTPTPTPTTSPTPSPAPATATPSPTALPQPASTPPTHPSPTPTPSQPDPPGQSPTGGLILLALAGIASIGLWWMRRRLTKS